MSEALIEERVEIEIHEHIYIKHSIWDVKNLEAYWTWNQSSKNLNS